MKKLISLALLLAMILSLAACGGAPAQSAPPSSAPSSTPAESPAAPTDAPPASGTPWPEKAVTIVVPFGNGGDSDFNARVLTEYLQAELGQTFVIENISGSGGSIGTAAVAEAENDGYTILSNHNSIQISYASEIGKYNVSDFEIIGIYAQNPGDVIAVASSSGITDMKGLVEASQQKKMTVATNIGATTQVESFMLGEYANVTQVDVGAVADKIVALLGGQVDIIIGPYGNIQPYVESGDMNILGVCTPERAAGYPEVPTCKEQGYDIVWQTSFILGFPKGTDQAIVDKFGAAVKKIVTTNKDYADAIMASYYESPTWYDKDEALKLLQSAERAMIKTNRVLEKLRQGKPVIGCQIRSRSPMIAEIYGQCGFDYVFIEGEHFPYGPESVLQMVRGCECGGIEPILRIVDHDPGKILQFLDMGVTGLLLPHCDTPQQAKAIMDAGKYRPLGNRGFSNTSRSTGYGAMPMDEYKAAANQNTMLIPMIESRQAVESLDEILATGVDTIHLGPGDLAESYGLPVGHKVVQEAIDLTLAKAAAASVPVGTTAATPEEAVQNLRRGFRMISFSSDLMLLREAGSRAVRQIQETMSL